MRFIAVLAVFVLGAVSVYSQEPINTSDKFEINGYLNLDSGERLVGAELECVLTYREQVISASPVKTQSFFATTNEEGYYTITVPLRTSWVSIFLALRSHDGDSFRFPLPEPFDLTGRIRNQIAEKSKRLRFNYTMISRQGWFEERQKLNLYGENSDKGRLILVRGLPDRIKKYNRTDGSSGELWFYYTDGLVVRFLREERDRDFYFRPTKASATSGGRVR
jgi:hypothetical protein